MEKRAWLLKYKPVDWLPEYRKTYDMTDAVEYDDEGKMYGGGIRTVRLRRVNRNLVIPEQVYLSLKK